MSDDTPITITHGRSQGGWPSQGSWTYDDYMLLVAGLEDGRLYELIDGYLYITNPPSSAHTYAVAELRKHLGNYAHRMRRGHALTNPFQIHLSKASRPVQPDLVYIKADSWPGAKSHYFLGAPDLVVEVLDAGTYRVDQHIKFAAYERAGAPEYWIVNPHTRSIQVYALFTETYGLVKEFIGREVVESRTLAGLQITADSIFER